MTEFQPLAGIGVKNKAGEAVLWVRVKKPTGESPFVLFGYWPEKADDDAMREKMKLSKEMVKMLGSNFNYPVYDFHTDIEPQLKQYMTEAKGNVPDHPTQDDIVLEATDMVTGEKHKLVWGVSKKPL